MNFNKCKKIISGKTMAFSGHQCLNSIWKDGLCRIHHPETIAIRRDRILEAMVKKSLG